MPEVKTYRHLHVRGWGVASQSFRSPGMGSKKRPTPVEDRADHAATLCESLKDAVDDMAAYRAEQAWTQVPAAKRGMPITLEGRVDVDIDVGAARSTTRGLKLLNVQRSASGRSDTNAARDVATFFVTPQTLKSLTRNLQRYGEWVDEELETDEPLVSNDEIAEDDVRAKRPIGFWLFETASTIRATRLRDLWTDPLDRLPRSRDQVDWEVWTRRGFDGPFEAALASVRAERTGRSTKFVETTIHTVSATPEAIQKIIRASAAVVELRSASSFASDYLDMTPERRAKAVEAIAGRLTAPSARAPRVAVLDTGVDRNNPLLVGSLPHSRCFSADERWGVADHSGHGTKMAGVAQFGDLADHADGAAPIPLATALESVVVQAPPSSPALPARDAIRRAVELVERERHPRIFCLAQTTPGEPDDGRPSSTSGVIDQLGYGDGVATRLLVAAVGNAPHSAAEPYQVGDYADRNRRFGIQSPAQALNALAVGGTALKTGGVRQARLVAPAGDLSPTSRTAQGWPRPHPHKPDIVMEGGNFVVDPGDVFSRPSQRHLVLTTARGPGNALAMTGQTSAATALAAGLAARLLATYPNFRMETVRALMVHAADWTPQMLSHFERARQSGVTTGEAWASILDRYGWGVPNERFLFKSASNALTMIAEDELEPYEETDKGIRLKQMKFFKLPWPAKALRALGQHPVEMRCTLSYFVEPDPHAGSRDKLDRYALHRLKFDVRRFGEDDLAAQQRVNLLADEGAAVSVADDGWLGIGRQRGALGHEIWRGPAYRLAERDAVSVAPVRGWWGDMRNLPHHKRPVRFSLVVSIRTPEVGGDLMLEALTHVPASVLVESVVATVRT